MRKLLCLLVLFGAFNASAQRFVRYFDTVTDMAASNPADPNVYVVVGGSVSFNDNQAARWKWVTGSVDPADGNTVVSTWAGGWPGKPAGRWKKINEASGIVIDTSGFITNYNVVVVDNKAALQNINVTNNVAMAFVKGKYALNDGWEGPFTFNPVSVMIADDAFNVAPNTGVGMWERQTPNPLREIPATWFDPNLTNGVIQAAINYAASLSTNAVPGREVLLPPKFIEINGNTGLNMSNNVTLVGQNGTVLATSAGTVAGYQMIRANGVTNWGVKNLQLIGLASVGGYGIFVTNSSRGVWGGITFATNFTTAPVWITNSSEIVPFDDTWVQDSVRAYGAQGNNKTEDTLPFHMAINNRAQGVGGKVVVPPGSYSLKNLHFDRVQGLVLEALNQGGQGLTNFILTAFDPLQPIISMGSASASSGYLNRSITIRGLMFDGRGPSFNSADEATWARTLLSINGGTESVYLDNCEWQAFNLHGIELIGGSVNNSGVENITLNNPNIQVSLDTATNNTVGFYARYSNAGTDAGGDVTKVTIISGKMNGNNTYGHILGLNGVKVDMLATYLDGFGDHFVYMDNWTNAANTYHPHVWANHVTMDNHGASPIVVEDLYTDSFPWSFSGSVDTSGKYLWNAKQYTSYYFLTEGFPNMIYNPDVIGVERFSVPGDYYPGPNTLALDTSTNFLFSSTNGFRLQHADSRSVTAEANTNAAVSIRELTVVWEVLTVTFVAPPVDGVDTFTLNGRTRRWVSVVTDAPNEIGITGTANGNAAALYNHIFTYPYTNLLSGLAVTNNEVTLVGGMGSTFTNTSIGLYSTIVTNYYTNYSTMTMLQHGSLSRIIPGGAFHIDNAAANAVILMDSNALSSSITISPNGIGVQHSTPNLATLSVRGDASQVNRSEMSVATVMTNDSGTSAALSIQLQAQPAVATANNSTLWQGLNIETGTSGSSTNLGTVEAIRIQDHQRVSDTITNWYGVRIMAPFQSGDGLNGFLMTNFAVSIADQGMGSTNTALQTGTGRVNLGGTLEFPYQGFLVNTNTTLPITNMSMVIAGNGSPVIMTNLPTIPAGYPGQVIILTGSSSVDTVQLIDQGTLPGSNITLSTDGSITNLIFGKGDSHMFHYVGVPVTNWCLIR